MSRPLLLAVVGPTAIGKTSWAVKLAAHFDTAVLSADSRQFFREMTVGTAVPTIEEQGGIDHHFVQHLSIMDPYTVGDFEQDALQLIDQLSPTHETIVMAGGSGLYVDAVLYGLDKFPEVEDGIRTQLIKQHDQQGITSLQIELEQKDPTYFNEVDRDNPQRIIRALEVIRSSGQPFSSFRNRQKEARNFNYLLIGLEAEREIIYDRINRRVDLMMENGLLEEAKALYAYRNQNALQTVGYKELFTHFDGKHSLEDAIALIKRNTRRFAKRQLTWYRKNSDITWFGHDSSLEEVLSFIERSRP